MVSVAPIIPGCRPLTMTTFALPPSPKNAWFQFFGLSPGWLFAVGPNGAFISIGKGQLLRRARFAGDADDRQVWTEGRYVVGGSTGLRFGDDRIHFQAFRQFHSRRTNRRSLERILTGQYVAQLGRGRIFPACTR